MKDILKKNYKNIIAFILGGLLLNKAVVYAVTLTSGNVSYDHSSSGLAATNLQSAIDEVYVKTGECNSRQTLTAYFNGNGATLSKTTASCTISGSSTSCEADAPTITRSGYNIVGFNTSSSSTSNNSAYNTSTKKITLTSSNTGSTWYAVTYKAGTTYTANFSASGSNSNGASISSTKKTCTTATAYNTTTPATSCSLTAPTITPATNYKVVGFGTTSSTSTSSLSSGGTLTMTSSNSGNTWYAITREDPSSCCSAYVSSISSKITDECYAVCKPNCNYSSDQQMSACMGPCMSSCVSLKPSSYMTSCVNNPSDYGC